MKSINTSIAPKLILRRSISISKSFELVQEDELVGRLRYEYDNNTAIAELADGTWLFRNTTQINPHISVWTQERDFVAMFELNRRGDGNLLIHDGQRLTWEKTHGYPIEWCYRDLLGDYIMKFKPEADGYRTHGQSIISPEGFKLPAIGLYNLLGWYTILAFYSSRNKKKNTMKYTPW